MSESATKVGSTTPSSRTHRTVSSTWNLRGKRVAVVVFSTYPFDPRSRRGAEALASERMNVDVVCLMEAGKEPKRETLKGVDILRVPLKRRRGGIFSYVFQYLAFLLISSIVLAVR